MNTYIRMLICLTAIAVLAAPSGAQSTPFVIGGWIFYENGTACDDPAVNITNLDTGVEWQAGKNASSNYYQITRANGTDLNATDILQFNAISPDGSQSNTTEHTVTSEDINNGGLFSFNVTLKAIHDVYIRSDYGGACGTGIRIDNATITEIALDKNLTIGDTYFIKYRVINNGTAGTETVNITVKISNATGWDKELANYQKNVKSYHNGNVTWNTAGLAPDNYNITVNASIPMDCNPEDNERTREVTLESPTVPDNTPPASITDLQNTTYEQTYINWTWTDPADADFSKVMVYLDGIHRKDVLKGVQCYNATGLIQDTEYEIATRTVDNVGNINDTWENRTAMTKPGAALEMDLIIETITPNCGGYIFGNESNNISAVVKNIGSDDAGASHASFVLGDGYSETAVVGALAPGASETVTITDPTIRAAGAAVTITVTSDCDDEIAESNEANNATVLDVTVVNNGYKGKTYTGGPNMTTWKTYDLNGNLVYSVGDSYYLGSFSNPHWTTYNASWDASDLPVTGAVVEARLYTTYTWDTDGVMPDDVGISFNGVDQTLEVHYWDDRTFPDSKPYGMLAYNVTDDFNTGGNVANLTNSHTGGGNVSMRGMLLVVIYENVSEPRRLIYVNEEFDLLYGGSSKCATQEEATAWAPIIDSIDTSTVADATLITVAPGADGPEGELIFNGQVWNDVWSFADSTQLGIDERDVASYLESTDNLVGFQSSGDWMEASNAILIVSQKSGEITPPTVTATPSSPVSDIEGASRTFSIDIDQTVNVTWLLDGAVVKDTEKGVTSASYTRYERGCRYMERLCGCDECQRNRHADMGLDCDGSRHRHIRHRRRRLPEHPRNPQGQLHAKL